MSDRQPTDVGSEPPLPQDRRKQLQKEIEALGQSRRADMTVPESYQVVAQSLSLEAWGEIVKKAVQQAKDGDADARDWLKEILDTWPVFSRK